MTPLYKGKLVLGPRSKYMVEQIAKQMDFEMATKNSLRILYTYGNGNYRLGKKYMVEEMVTTDFPYHSHMHACPKDITKAQA